MEYTPTIWDNDGAPAIDATNLNKIEDGIIALNNEKLDASIYNKNIVNYEPVATSGGNIFGFKSLVCTEKIPEEAIYGQVYNSKLYYVYNNYIYSLDLTSGKLVTLSPQLNATVSYTYRSGSYTKISDETLGFSKVFVVNEETFILYAKATNYEYVRDNNSVFNSRFNCYFYTFDVKTKLLEYTAKVSFTNGEAVNNVISSYSVGSNFIANDDDSIYILPHSSMCVFKLSINNLGNYKDKIIYVTSDECICTTFDSPSFGGTNNISLFFNDGNMYLNADIYPDYKSDNFDNKKTNPFGKILPSYSGKYILCDSMWFPIFDSETLAPVVGNFYHSLPNTTKTDYLPYGFIYEDCLYMFIGFPSPTASSGDSAYLFKSRLF